MIKKIGLGVIFIFFISILRADTDTFWIDKGVRYKHFRNAVADLMGGVTSVKIIKNKNGENEFVIENEKHHAVMLEFSDGHAKVFAEYVAMSNTATILDKSLELLETPLKVDYKSYLDGTFLSSMTSTGLFEKDLPKNGSIKIYLGNKKAMVVTAIGIFASSLDFGLSYAELASGKSVGGLKKYIQYVFFYDAIRNPELINACVTILANLPKNASNKEIETALIQIKDEYMKYLDGNFKALLSKYLYSLLDFKTTDAFERGLKLTLAQVKNLALIEKFGKNILVPLSALTADIVKGERTIGWQFFYNENGRDYPRVAKDIPIGYKLNEKITYLLHRNIYSVLYLKDYRTQMNPDKAISAGHFIDLVKDVYKRRYGKELSMNVFFPIQDKLYKSGSTTEFKESILLKDAIAVLYYLFEESYANRF